MSPIVARAAIRAASFRAAGQRQFSVMRSMRNFARSFEPHAFQRLPVTSEAQSPDYAKLFKRSASTLAIYVPGIALVLGWPAIAYGSLDGRVQ